jgi:hypothetical protein
MPKRSWLLCLLIAIAFVTTIAIMRPWKADSAATTEPSTSSAEFRTAEQARLIQPTEVALSVDRRRRNTAVQKAGPPDPVAEQTAAASAEKSAQAAARLAETQ